MSTAPSASAGSTTAASNGAAPSTTDAQLPGGPALTHRQILVILTGLMSGMFLAALDQTIVATSIRTIADHLQGLSLQAWATTAYLITSTITTPLYGKLSDIYGRRPYFIFAISVFVLGSALSGMSQTMYQLAAFRAVQGIGAGGLFSLALAIIADMVPPRERARYQGYFLAVFGTSSVLGPMVGGFLAGQATILGISGWRWVFLVNVPIGIASLALVARTLHLPHSRRDHRIDYPGAVALVVALVPLLVVAEQGRQWGWTSPRSLTAYVIGVVGIIGFLLAERAYGDEALLPLRLFRGKTFSLGTSLSFIVGMGMFGGLVSLPLYMQIVKGESPTAAGLLLLPLTFGIMAGTLTAGQMIARTGRYKVFPVIGVSLLLVAMLLMSRVSADTSLVVVDLYGVVFGLGLGFNMQTLVVAIQNAVPATDMGVATSSATFFRQMGGTLGTALFLSVLFNGLPTKIREAFQAIAPTREFQSALKDPAVLADPANKPVLDLLAGGAHGAISPGTINDSSFIGHLDPRLARPFLVGFADAMDVVFLLGAGVLTIAFILVWFLPEEPLRTMSGIQAVRQEQAEAAAAALAGDEASDQPVTPTARLRGAEADGEHGAEARGLQGEPVFDGRDGAG